MRMRSPFLRCFTMSSIMLPRIASDCFFESSCASATLAERCFRVTVGAVVLAAMGLSPLIRQCEHASYARRISDSRWSDYAEVIRTGFLTRELLRIDGQI